MGYDADHPRSEGEVGKTGVSVSSLADMEILFDGIPLDKVSTSMTINGPAVILWAFYIAAAEKQGVDSTQLRGTVQNDILKEYMAQHAWCFPIEPALRLIVDGFEWGATHAPLWNTISISGYHIREAGSTAAQELAFTLANGFAYVELGRKHGLDVDAFAPRLSFFFNAHIDFFEEIAKYRAARRIWARWMKDRYGAQSERSMQLRFHTQTAGVSLTAQQPEVNIVRTAIEALAGVLGGTQSLHTNSMDETLALPTDKAARIALRTQQVIANETRVPNVADPLGGSWYVEALTDEMERRAEEIFAQIERMGDGSMLDGAIRGCEEGWYQGEIADSAYTLERKLNAGTDIVVGVNAFTEGNHEPPPPTLRIGPEVEEEQRRRLEKVKRERDDTAVAQVLDRVRADARDPERNLMPAFLDAVRAYATLGEIVDACADEFGRWVEDPRI
jgi:methylmalonyl-CoA mutase N-terminal domain/subunit